MQNEELNGGFLARVYAIYTICYYILYYSIVYILYYNYILYYTITVLFIIISYILSLYSSYSYIIYIVIVIYSLFSRFFTLATRKSVHDSLLTCGFRHAHVILPKYDRFTRIYTLCVEAVRLPLNAIAMPFASIPRPPIPDSHLPPAFSRIFFIFYFSHGHLMSWFTMSMILLNRFSFDVFRFLCFL